MSNLFHTINAKMEQLVYSTLLPPNGKKYRFDPQDDMTHDEVVALLKALNITASEGLLVSSKFDGVRRHFKKLEG
jgi:hypothetical protein